MSCQGLIWFFVFKSHLNPSSPSLKCSLGWAWVFGEGKQEIMREIKCNLFFLGTELTTYHIPFY